jgi:uncharacterized protein (DUF2164 family)
VTPARRFSISTCIYSPDAGWPGRRGNDGHRTLRRTQETASSLDQALLRRVSRRDIGDLKAGLLLDYCLKEIGPVFYNRAIADAQAYFQERVVDLEGVCYEKEFTFWAPKPSGRSPRRSRL